MAVPTSIDDLSATAASNGPDGATDLPSAYDDYIRAVSAFIRQLRDGKEFPPLLSSVAGTDTVTASAPAAITAYAAGQRFSFVASATNTGAVTLNINSLGAKDVTKRGTTALAAGDITSGQIVLVEYDGTRFQMIGVTSAASDIAAGIVELATNAEAQAGTDTARAVTPAALASVTATETRAGLVELATSAEAQAGTDTTRAVTPAGVKAAQIINATAQAATSGTSIDFTSIPSWVKRVTMNLSVVSTSGSDPLLIQIGDSGGLEVTGYSASAAQVAGGSAGAAYTAGFGLSANWSSGSVMSGIAVLSLLDSATNTWAMSFTGAGGSTTAYLAAGSKALSAALDRISLTTSGGSNTFDAGLVNISYE